MILDKSQIGLAGEYYVLAQLTARGFIATLTLGNTKGIDILVTNQEINKLFKVEVKLLFCHLTEKSFFIITKRLIIGQCQKNMKRSRMKN